MHRVVGVLMPTRIRSRGRLIVILTSWWIIEASFQFTHCCRPTSPFRTLDNNEIATIPAGLFDGRGKLEQL